MRFGLVCGAEQQLNKSHIVFLTQDDVIQLLQNKKNSFTVSITKGGHYYRIPLGDSKELNIPRKRLKVDP